MENSSKTIIIVGAVVVVILLVSVGMFVNNIATSSTEVSLNKFSAQEVEAVNSQYEPYLGEKRGNDVIGLISKLIANAGVFGDDVEKMPEIVIDENMSAKTGKVKGAQRPKTDEEVQTYIDNLAVIKNQIEKKHIYKVEVEINRSGMIDKIIINY